MRWDTTRDSKPSIFRSEKFWIACIIIGIIGLLGVAAYNPSDSSTKTAPPVVCHASNGCFQGQSNVTGTFRFVGRAGNATINAGSNKTYVGLWFLEANFSGMVKLSFYSHDNSTRSISSVRISDMNSTQYFTSNCYSAPSALCIVGPGSSFRYVTINQSYVNFNVGHVYSITITCDVGSITQYAKLNLQ